jgi:hypothetical protein
MEYDEKWKEIEKLIDNQIPSRSEIDKKKIYPSIKGLNLSDILIIRNWISYADLIGDYSYKEIYNTEIDNTFMNNILKVQIHFRKKNFNIDN